MTAERGWWTKHIILYSIYVFIIEIYLEDYIQVDQISRQFVNKTD